MIFSHFERSIVCVLCVWNWMASPLESGRGERICIHLLYLNGTEEEPREKVEPRT